jgi:hypothetical protein
LRSETENENRSYAEAAATPSTFHPFQDALMGTPGL